MGWVRVLHAVVGFIFCILSNERDLYSEVFRPHLFLNIILIIPFVISVMFAFIKRMGDEEHGSSILDKNQNLIRDITILYFQILTLLSISLNQNTTENNFIIFRATWKKFAKSDYKCIIACVAIVIISTICVFAVLFLGKKSVSNGNLMLQSKITGDINTVMIGILAVVMGLCAYKAEE